MCIELVRVNVIVAVHDLDHEIAVLTVLAATLVIRRVERPKQPTLCAY
jgi:hypothetical protein